LWQHNLDVLVCQVDHWQIDSRALTGYRSAMLNWPRLRRWRWALIVLVALLAITYGALSYMMGGPRDVYGFLRYALPHWHRGDLRVGNSAPNIELVALDGQSRFSLRDRIGARPLVLIFGSYT
jgi:hypothetical protein